MKHYQLKNNSNYNFNGIYLRKATRIDVFAVRLDSISRRTTIDNAEDFYFKYSLDKFEQEKTLDLKVDYKEEKFEDEKEMLKINGELDSFVKQILKNKDQYLLKPIIKKDDKLSDHCNLEDELANLSFNERTTSLKNNKKLLFPDFISLRATLRYI